jgi:signal peptidase I
LALWALLGLRPYRIPSASMADTLQPGDFILVDALSYGGRLPLLKQFRLPALRAPRPGEVVVLRDPEDPGEACVKRCIAVEGDTVELHDGGVWVNGRRLVEPYLTEQSAGADSVRVVVPARGVYLLGDARARSRDSRAFGCVDRGALLGRVLLIYFSWDEGNDRVRVDRLLARVR